MNGFKIRNYKYCCGGKHNKIIVFLSECVFSSRAYLLVIIHLRIQNFIKPLGMEYFLS